MPIAFSLSASTVLPSIVKDAAGRQSGQLAAQDANSTTAIKKLFIITPVYNEVPTINLIPGRIYE